MAGPKQDGSLTRAQSRTRRALLDAAAALVREGGNPTVAEAAERALVSRATAYRYFPSQLSLLIELQADATQPSPHAVLADVGEDVTARIDAVVRVITRMVLADEALFRTQMRVTQELWLDPARDPTVPIREGRRLTWIDHALAPLTETAPETRKRLRNALAVVIGVEPVLALRDVCGMDSQEIEDSLAWTATTLVAATIDLPQGTPQR